jgi:YD repeat-containing protein
LKRLGRIRDFDYDTLKRLIKETWYEADATTVVKQINLDYDAVGNLETASDDTATYEMTYDSRNRLETVTSQYQRKRGQSMHLYIGS